MNLKRMVVCVAMIICAGLFYEVDYILTYLLSSDHAAEEVKFYDNFFSVLLLAMGLWLLFQEVSSYVRARRKEKGETIDSCLSLQKGCCTSAASPNPS